MPQRGGFRLAAALGESFRVIGEPDGQRQHHGDDAVIKARGAGRTEQIRLDGQRQRHQRADPDDEHDRIADLHPRIEFEERILQCLEEQVERIAAAQTHATEGRAERLSACAACCSLGAIVLSSAMPVRQLVRK